MAACALVVTISAAFQAAFVLETRSYPDFTHPPPGLDVNLHWENARQVRANGFRELNPEAAMMSSRAPVFWLAATQIVLGENMWRHRLLHTGLGVLTVAVLFFLGSWLTGRTVGGVCAALLLAIQPAFVYSSSLPLQSTLELLLFAGALLLVGGAIRARARSAAATLAATAALLFLLAALNQWFMLGPFLVLAALAASGRGAGPSGFRWPSCCRCTRSSCGR